jgi:ABC-type Mn2+/Zn2+ transport system ATPase subunit
MDMLGHDHKAENHEAIASAGLFQNAKEQVAAASGGQQGLTLIATASDEMQIAASEKAPQPRGIGTG